MLYVALYDWMIETSILVKWEIKKACTSETSVEQFS